MSEIIQNYNFNSLYICLLLFAFTNYEYINIILHKLYLLNYTSFVIALNIVGFYLLLKKITFEVNIKINF